MFNLIEATKHIYDIVQVPKEKSDDETKLFTAVIDN